MFFAHSPGSRARSRLVARPLRLESLESRHVLSSMTGLDSDPCIVTSPDTTAETLANLAGPVSPGAAPIGPLEADDYYALLDGTSTASAAAEGEGIASPVVNSPPVVIEFFGSNSGSQLELRGTVGDDKSPELCRIEFGGPLAGQTASVSPDGSFTFHGPQVPFSESITARAVDAEGLYSEWVTVAIMA